MHMIPQKKLCRRRQELKHNTLSHQPEKDQIATSCLLVVSKDAGLEVEKELFPPEIKHIYGYLFKIMSSYVSFHYLLHFLCHIPTHISHIQQEQTYYQAPPVHSLKSREHKA